MQLRRTVVEAELVILEISNRVYALLDYCQFIQVMLQCFH